MLLIKVFLPTFLVSPPNVLLIIGLAKFLEYNTRNLKIKKKKKDMGHHFFVHSYTFPVKGRTKKLQATKIYHLWKLANCLTRKGRKKRAFSLSNLTSFKNPIKSRKIFSKSQKVETSDVYLSFRVPFDIT